MIDLRQNLLPCYLDLSGYGIIHSQPKKRRWEGDRIPFHPGRVRAVRILCAKYLQLGPLGPSLESIFLTSKGDFKREHKECVSEDEGWEHMEPRMGVRSDEDGALFIGCAPTNIEYKDTTSGQSKLRINFTPSIDPKFDLIIWGERDFVLRCFILSHTLAHSHCQRKFNCLQPVGAKFDKVVCSHDPCLARELLQIKDFISFWINPSYVNQLSAENSSICGEHPPLG